MVEGRGGVSGADRLGSVIVAASVLALIGVLLVPLLQAANGDSISGASLIGDRSELCYGCVEDAPYPMFLWLELITVLVGLLAGLALCFRGEGGSTVARTVLLAVSALLLFWAPFQTSASGRPVAVLPIFEAGGIAVAAVAVLALRRSRSRGVVVARAVLFGVAGAILLTVPGTRRQMPITYDRLMWGYLVGVFATAVAFAIATAATATRWGWGPAERHAPSNA